MCRKERKRGCPLGIVPAKLNEGRRTTDDDVRGEEEEMRAGTRR
jgi:hypothetical protein